MSTKLSIELKNKNQKKKLEKFLKEEEFVYKWDEDTSNELKTADREKIINNLLDHSKGKFIINEDPTLPTGERWDI